MEERVYVLDKGYVVLVDHMGSDVDIVNAARVSYGKTAKSDDMEGNTKLINFLMKNNHTSPFEQVVFKFKIKLPIFVARELVRHRTARLNEISARYTELPQDLYIPSVERIKKQSTANKQASGESVDADIADRALLEIGSAYNEAWFAYQEMLNMGVAREVARIVLPVGIYTEMIWQIDLHNLFHFLDLRDSDNAQWEIRQYAIAMKSLIQPIVPIAYNAYKMCKGLEE